MYDYKLKSIINMISITNLGGSIYAFLENSDINNTQILDTTTGTWSKGDDLPRSRSAAACEVFELNGNF